MAGITGSLQDSNIQLGIKVAGNVYLATREQQGPAGAGSPSSGAVLLPYWGLREPVVLWTSKAGKETQTKCKMRVVSGIRDASRNIRVNK